MPHAGFAPKIGLIKLLNLYLMLKISCNEHGDVRTNYSAKCFNALTVIQFPEQWSRESSFMR